MVLLTGDSRIMIRKVRNKTFYSVENLFQNDLEQAFYSNGFSVGKSKTFLEINILDITKTATSYSSENVPTEFKMSINIEYTIFKSEKEIKKGKITDYGLYNPQTDDENKALDDAVKKISQKIVENSIDKW